MNPEQSTVKPSFAVDVRRMISDGRLEAAFALSADGVRAFPTYLGGYVLLAECFAALEHSEDAAVIEREAKRRFGYRRRRIEEQKNKRIEERNRGIEEQKNRGAEIPGTRNVEPGTRNVEPGTPNVEPGTRNSLKNESPLRIIEFAHPSTDKRVIRSASVRLIPGLEYTSLRFEGAKNRGRRSIQLLSDPPPFREFHPTRKSPFPTEKPARQKKLSLEELAVRIGKVRITPADLERQPAAPDPLASPRTAVVSETLARIYMTQKSFDRAIDAFTQLKKQQPENATKFDELIEECKKRRIEE